MAKVISPYGLRPELNLTTGCVKIQLVKRESKEVVSEREFYPSQLPGKVQEQLLLAGTSTTLQQRVSSLDPFDKLDGMDKVWELAWMEGKWELPREVGPRVKAADRPTLEVMALEKGVVAVQLEDSWLALSDDQRQALREKFKEAAETWASENAPKAVDLTDLL